MPYGLAAPAAIIALPFAALLLLGGRTPGVRMLAGAAGGFAVWWLLGQGELPDQTVRAAALITALAFAALSRVTRWSVTHRALVAVAAATAGIVTVFLVSGWSWSRLHWWIEFRTGPALRLLLAGATRLNTDGGDGVAPFGGGPRGFEDMVDRLVTTTADLFPAAVALQLLASLAIAAALAHRLVGQAAGPGPGRLAEFRFSEHLGWLLVLAVAVLLVPGAGSLRPVALNLLLVIGALYAVRGIGVIAFALRALRGGVLLYLVAAVTVFFVLPGVVLLGVLDAGLNLRRRLPPLSGD